MNPLQKAGRSLGMACLPQAGDDATAQQHNLLSSAEVSMHFLVNDIFMCFFFGLAIKEVTEAQCPWMPMARLQRSKENTREALESERSPVSRNGQPPNSPGGLRTSRLATQNLPQRRSSWIFFGGLFRLFTSIYDLNDLERKKQYTVYTDVSIS